MKLMLRKFGILLLAVIGFAACSDDNGNDTEGTARMSVKMVDDPGDYDAVYVDVQDVVVKYNGNESEVSIGEINTGVYNLLELTGGVSAELADAEIAAGTVSQIRLVLGDDNSIVVDGETYALATPSGQQSGLKIQLNETLSDGISYEFILDFDVEESIVVNGNGSYTLKPVIRASAAAETGAISGLVLPAGMQTLITARSGSTVISSYTNAEGAFKLSGVPEGTYELTLEADSALNLPPVVIPNVQVEIGAVTTIETVEF